MKDNVIITEFLMLQHCFLKAIVFKYIRIHYQVSVLCKNH